MEFITKVSFPILFLLIEQMPSSNANFADDYDITHTLNEIIFGIFQSFNPDSASELISHIRNEQTYNEGSFTYESKTATFHNIEITEVRSERTRISCIFHERIIGIHSPMFTVRLGGQVKSEDSYEKTWLLCAVMHFSDFVITAVKGSDQSIEVFYEFSSLKLDIEETSLNLRFRCYSAVRSIYEISLPEILLRNMKRSVKFIESLNNIYDYILKTQLISKHNDFLARENQYYYLIPSGKFAGYILKDLIIKGLSNFYSVNFEENPHNYILRIYHIQGSVDLLDQGTGSFTQFSFYFDSLTISVIRILKLKKVAAHSYIVINTKSKQRLNKLHTATLVGIVETAVALSIMPSLKYQISIKSKLSSKLVKDITFETPAQRFKETPLREKETTIVEMIPKTPPQQLEGDQTALLRSPTDLLDYQVLFNDVNITLVTGGESYPKHVQYELFSKLKFAQNINVLPYGKCNADDLTGINVHANVSSVNISAIKSSTCEDNDSCHFQIHVNQIIDVTSLSQISTINRVTHSFNDHELRKKLKQYLRR